MRRELLTPAAAICIALGAACTATDSAAGDAEPGGDAAGDTAPDDGEGSRGADGPDGTNDERGGALTTLSTSVVPAAAGSAFLGFFSDCPALLDHLRTEALERVTPWGLEGGFPGPMPTVLEGEDMAVEEAMTEDAVAASERGAPAATGPDFSGTNTQEVDVDEGDIVETDGTHVYIAGGTGLRIVAVDNAEVVARPELPDGDHQLLLDGDRLLVVTSSWTGSSDTITSLYDVSDPTDPELLHRTHLEGAVLATRANDGIARLVVSTSLHERLPFVQPDEFGLDEDAALERNEEIIEESAIDDWLPRRFDEADDGTFGPVSTVLDCSDVAAPREFSGLGMTWIGSVDVGADGSPVGSAGIVSTGDTVYASAGNVYVATRSVDDVIGIPIDVPRRRAVDVESDDDEDRTGPPPTLIHQFSLADTTGASYVASGEVPGRLLNQFAMSEHRGDLRVATTTDAFDFGERTESSVHVLRPDGDELTTISSITGLGVDEQIYAVRFLGDVGYVVTFRQIDPLYVIDLTDPEAPVLEGELKIPGYSSYLHPVGDDLLIGVGQDATQRGRATGTQISLFDVSDPRDPRRVDTLAIGGWSEVEWDHRAFLFWPPDGTIVLPVSPGWRGCGPDDDCVTDDISNRAGGAVVAELDGRELSVRGTISHPARSGPHCWNPLLRSIAIGDELATVAVDGVQFADRQTLEVRGGATWGDRDDVGCW